MRIVPILLVCLLVAIQFPLWLGKGGWMRVREAEQQLAAQNRLNAELEARNAKLVAEVKDLKEGAGAVEERARYELGMLKEGELFVQIVDAQTKTNPLSDPLPPIPPPVPKPAAKAAVKPAVKPVVKPQTASPDKR